ncbi:MAG: hypothetical protein WC898_01810 [Candidatus Paceibacterota bacterium]|jgi:phosphoribosylaminoimidazolecarboxamide formyltransferase/IMP cyclohydrolase
MQDQKIALISVYEKKGIEVFAKELVNMGWKILSSGGTARHLSECGISVTDVAQITGMGAILGHRVTTLHPKIHGGLLALNTPEHLSELEKYDIPWIDMVCVDFYPLKEETKNTSATTESVIEKTDIGGPTMIRSGAKGGRIVICDPDDREKVIEWIKKGEPDKEEFLKKLSAKAEMMIAEYCAVSGKYHGEEKYEAIFGERTIECVYGENGWQKPAGFFKNFDSKNDLLSIDKWEQKGGSSMSYNNICDLDRMMQTITHIGAGYEKNFGSVPFIALGVKHGNACGVGVSETDKTETVHKMLLGDLRAIFGGSVMLNFSVDEKIAEELIHSFASGRRLLDVVCAPSFTEEAIEILSRKKGKCRLLENNAIEKAGIFSLDIENRVRYVRGGFLKQPNYTFVPNLSQEKEIPEEEKRDIVLAWAVGATSNSNTITLVKENRLYGNGVGQQDRVGASKLAIFRADESAKSIKEFSAKADLLGASAYSDSFFPFVDAVEVLSERGIKNIFSTSGSINDEKIREFCKEKGIKLLLLPDSEARGFYQH